jgi:NAD(P)-dependent dehydrogenase (short-subunit alcohol dehydrogenase family)
VGRDYNFPDTPIEPARRDIARAGLRILEWDHQQRRTVGNRIASAIDSGVPDATLFARIDTPHNGDRVCVGVHEMGATKVALVTGASSGIGKEIAKALVAGGWRVIGTGRTPPRIASAEAEIRAAAAQGGAITMLAADLSLMGQAAGLARQVLAMTDRLDLLINNAGGMTAQKVITAEGLEANFAGNHLGPFLLTRELLPLLTRTAAGEPYGAVRILNTASDASEMIPALDLEDMQGLANFDPGRAYCSGKLANVLLARALADRLDGQGIVAHSVHPGAVETNFFSNASPETQARLKHLPKATEAEGADTLIWLASAPEAAQSNGDYWHKRARREPNPTVYDKAVRDRFWAQSEALVEAALQKAAAH